MSNPTIILTPAERTYCAACGAPLRPGDSAIDAGGRTYCGGECAGEDAEQQTANQSGENMKKKAPTNTAKEMEANPGKFLREGIAFGGSNAIEAQEWNGQGELVKSDTLPTNGLSQLTYAGIKIVGPVEGDEMFSYVQLPAGWQKVRTDHSMWSKLLDEKGRERASMFYKAAFYDRDAHVNVSCRFSSGRDWSRTDGVVVAVVTDCGKIIFSTKELRPPKEKTKADYAAIDALEKEAEAWLVERYPDWQNPAAYWD